jgi:hypothetical protein
MSLAIPATPIVLPLVSRELERRGLKERVAACERPVKGGFRGSVRGKFKVCAITIHSSLIGSRPPFSAYGVASPSARPAVREALELLHAINLIRIE